MDTIRKLQRARAALILGQPFFGALALGQRLVERQDIPTMATNGESIFYNPTWVETLTQGELEGVFAHEVMHTAVNHHTRRQNRDPRDWNRSGDHAINLILKNAKFTLPKGGLYDPAFANKSAEEIYRLIHSEDKNKGSGSGQGAGDGDSDSDPGGCGEVWDAPAPDGTARQATASEMAVAEQEQKIRTIQAANAAKAQGKLSAEIARLVEELLEPQLDWKAVLRDFIDRTAANDFSWASPSRRYLASGLYLPQLKSQKMGEIVVAVDTSGSIGPKELSVFSAEMREIFESVRPEKIHCVYIDSQVCGHDEFDEPEDFAMNARGGGGTSLGRLWPHLEERGIEPVCTVFFTDLCNSDWNDDPGHPVIWCATGDYGTPPYGEVIRVHIE